MGLSKGDKVKEAIDIVEGSLPKTDKTRNPYSNELRGRKLYCDIGYQGDLPYIVVVIGAHRQFRVTMKSYEDPICLADRVISRFIEQKDTE